MKTVIQLYILLASLLVSCSEPYFPEIAADKKVLVVNGLVTNEITPYHINLSYAASFDSTSKGMPLTSARVTVTDDHGNHYLFQESDEGDYVSNPSQFTGVAGYSYTMHIITQDGLEYESDPQLLPIGNQQDTIYAEYDYKETISKVNGLVILSHGANILTDIENQSDSLPGFRFSSYLVNQYFYNICPIMQACYYFYCWQTEEANPDINLTGGAYANNSASITKHEICFIVDNPTCYSLRYGIGPLAPDMSVTPLITTVYDFFPIHSRLLYLSRYGLNNAAGQYYKSMDKQLKSDGKLFDPIAVQIIGNINCISNPENKAFGFFEASSVSTSAFAIDFRNLTNGQPSIKKIQNISPKETIGCKINAAPAFWVF
jgi:hypothetical protein